MSNKKNLVFPHMCFVGVMEKWRDKKLFYLVEKKNEMIKNVVYTNLLLWLY